MFRISALLFVAIVGFQYGAIVGTGQNAAGAGDCIDFLEYDVNCPYGPGIVCELNTYDAWSSNLLCHIMEEELNANVARDPSGDCETYNDANGDPCPRYTAFQGNYRNTESGCTKIPCISPF